jgi:hypothetical protein
MGYLGHKVWPSAGVTANNIEENVKAWSHDFGLSVQQKTDPDSYWFLNLTYANGLQLSLRRPKSKENDPFIQFEAIVSPDPDQQVIFDNLSKDQSKRIADELVLELAKARISYHFLAQPPAPFKGVLIAKAVSITRRLNRYVFSSYLDEMQSEIILVEQTIVLDTTNKKTTRPHPVP